MSQLESLTVLFAFSDPHMAHQVSEKIRSKYPQFPFDFVFFEDGKRALGEIQNNRPDLLVVTSELPTLDGRSLIREVRRQDGSIAILFLRTPSQAPIEGEEDFVLPVVNWADFLARFQNLIPDDWKAKFGLFERNSVLAQKLVEFGKQYATQDKEVLSKALVCIPKYFDSAGTQEKRSALQTKSSEKIVFRELSPQDRKRALLFEGGLLLVLTIALVLSLTIWNEQTGEGLFSLKGALILLTSFSYLGFFLGRAFDRFIYVK